METNKERVESASEGPVTCRSGDDDGDSHVMRVGLFYDGITFKILSDYYLHEHWRQSRLSFGGIEGFVKVCLQRMMGRTPDVTEQHLFIGVARWRGAQGRSSGLAPNFERVMQVNGVKAHYFEQTSGGEKGVDTALTIEMLQLAWTRRIDVAVLLATDGDFAPLAKAVRAAGVPVVLLGFHLPHSKRQPLYMSLNLTDAVTAAIDMPEMIERPLRSYQQAIENLFCVRNHQSARLPRCA